MSRIKLTSKRQATFPSKVCTELGVGAGDELQIESVRIKGKKSWVLKPVPKPHSSWIGSLSKYAIDKKSHSMEDIRKSIARGRSVEE